MSTQCAIDPITLEIQPPADSSDGHKTAAATTDNRAQALPGAEQDHDDTMVDPGDVDYLTRKM